VREAQRRFWHEPSDAEILPGEDAISQSAVDQFVQQRPDINAARADLQAARARLDLARAMQRPNIGVGPFYEQTESGAHLLGVQVARELAIINTGAPLVRQRQAEVEQKCETLRQGRLKATFEIRTAAERYERNRRVVEALRRDLEASMRTQEQQLTDLFEAGQTDLLHVYTARTQLLTLQTSQLDSLNELALSAADLTAATGMSAASLIDTAEK
jgi:outer membrane protein TolC